MAALCFAASLLHHAPVKMTSIKMTSDDSFLEFYFN